MQHRYRLLLPLLLVSLFVLPACDSGGDDGDDPADDPLPVVEPDPRTFRLQSRLAGASPPYERALDVTLQDSTETRDVYVEGACEVEPGDLLRLSLLHDAEGEDSPVLLGQVEADEAEATVIVAVLDQVLALARVAGVGLVNHGDVIREFACGDLFLIRTATLRV